MATEDFPNEDFDDLPLDELDSVIFQDSTNDTDSHRITPQNNNKIPENPNRAAKPQTAQFEQHTLNGSGSRLGSSNSSSTTQKIDYRGCTRGATEQLFSPAAAESSRELEFVTNDEGDFMDEDMDCFFNEVETCKVQTGKTRGPNPLLVQQGPSTNRESAANKTETSASSCRLSSDSSTSVRDMFSCKPEPAFESLQDTPQGQSYTLSTAKKDPQSDSSVAALTLTSPPFTYLCLLEEMMSKPDPHTTAIHVKAFIVTLLGKLSSNNGLWRICATISDGSGYLDVELSNEVLTGLLGFSVAEKGALKRDPARRGELETGMRRCQEELVDMCCVMTIVVEPEGKKAVVTKADPVDEKVLQQLEQRVRDRRK